MKPLQKWTEEIQMLDKSRKRALGHWHIFHRRESLRWLMLQVKCAGDMRNFEAEKAKPAEDTGYKSTGVFADF
jgi:hypothetical protein